MQRILSILLVLSVLVSYAQEFSPRYEMVKLNKEVNSYYHDAAPIISVDGKQLYFFIHNHPQNTFGKQGSDDIWVSKLGDNGQWGAPQHLGSPFNIHRSNQVFTALPDGSLFIKGGRQKDTKGFSIVSPGGSLTEIEVPGFKEMNKGRFYGASMSSDMKHIILFFGEMANSTRSSLYVSNLDGDGKWTRPVKLNISTRDDDFGPFIGPDDKTLYFASDRNVPGKFGKSDIYKTTRLDDTWQNWSEPVNMGSPINTAAGEMYFCIDKAGNVFMSRSVIGGDGGTLDLWKLVPRDVIVKVVGTIYNEKTQQPIEANVQVKPAGSEVIQLHAQANGRYETKIPEVKGVNIAASQNEFLPKEVSVSLPDQLGNDATLYVDLYLTPIAKKLLLTGTVFDNKTMKPVSANLNVQLKEDRKENFSLRVGSSAYEQEIKKTGWYMYTASAEGYINAVDSVEVISEEITPVIKDIFLQPIEVGLTVRLKNIYFDFDKTTLKRESFVELNKVVDFLKQNSSVEIQIEGHTDSKGSDEYNLNLSQGRSQSVVDYLVSQGISASRLGAQGFGESTPIDTNDTDAGRANNRRVEFRVVKK
ncbi:MAG: OmpA family protein [Cyclobacteriaceae bacterium]|nr:OmpA family protein [Cyclobacteriaceae bacterium]